MHALRFMVSRPARAVPIHRRMRRLTKPRVTPSMRRKVDDLATWIAAGNRDRLREARQSIVQLLCAAAGMTDVEAELSRPTPKRRKK
jgi:hypothetical protein